MESATGNRFGVPEPSPCFVIHFLCPGQTSEISIKQERADTCASAPSGWALCWMRLVIRCGCCGRCPSPPGPRADAPAHSAWRALRAHFSCVICRRRLSSFFQRGEALAIQWSRSRRHDGIERSTTGDIGGRGHSCLVRHRPWPCPWRGGRSPRGTAGICALAIMWTRRAPATRHCFGCVFQFLFLSFLGC